VSCPTLTLVRHAHAEWPGYSGRDIDRPLNNGGPDRARDTARAIRSAGLRPDVILCSPARRTRETADILARELELATGAMLVDDRLYNASADALESAALEAATGHAHVLMVGHNPGISELARRLSGDSRREPMKPAGWVSFPRVRA